MATSNVPGTLFSIMRIVACIVLCAAALAAQRPRAPRPERLDVGVEWHRDPVTGELRARRTPTEGAGASDAPAVTGAIRVRVNLVSLSFNVFGPDGAPIRNLPATDFRVYEDGVEQAVEHFDAASEPARVVLALDTSPSVARDLDAMKQAAATLAARLDAQDEVAVVAFAAESYLVLPFTADRRRLARAFASLEVLRQEGGRGSNIYRALFLSVTRLFADPASRGRKAVVLLTDGQDSGLGLTWDPASAEARPGRNWLTFEDVSRALTAIGVEVHVISTQPRPAAMTEAWLAARAAEPLVTPQAREAGMPHYTLYLAELVRLVGGRLNFLREAGSLEAAYRHVAETLGAQYTLGYYPKAGLAKPGWRTMRVEVRGRTDVRVTHRAAYYVPAAP